MNSSSIEAVLSHEGNEARPTQGGAADRRTVALDQGEGLGDGLAGPDRQRAVVVGAVAHRGGNEDVAGCLGERFEDGQVADSLGSQRLHEARAVARVTVPGRAQSPASHERTTSISL